MRIIVLGGEKAAGRGALVDDGDYELVSQYRWHLVLGTRPDTVYAQTNVLRPGTARRTTRRIHQIITGWERTDHISGDGLDNRRSNLRPATNTQNSRNQKPRGGVSRYKGVTLHSRACPKWRARICIDSKEYSLGVFDDEVSAALAYDAAAREVYGAFARPNFPAAA